MIPYGKHSVGEADIAAVVDVLQNQFLTQGEQVPKFEQALANYCQAEFAVAVNSGTSALHVACLALGVDEGDMVWTSPISFVASANCALYCGADIDFVDISPQSRNICPDKLAQKLQAAAAQNSLPKAIIVVHYSGESCDMKTIKRLTQAYGICIIEDASHALGGQYQDKPIGCCAYSDIAITSFHPVKSITSAEGGALLTNSAHLHEQAVLFAKHGITRNAQLMEGPSDGPWYYQQIALGYNYRLSDLHAALGFSQLQQIDTFIAQRRAIAQRYSQALKGLPLQLPVDSGDSAWHLYSVQLTAHPRTAVFTQLQQAGIGVNVHYIPIHLQPYYRAMGFSVGQFPEAESFYQQALTLPIFPGLTEHDQDTVIAHLTDILR